MKVKRGMVFVARWWRRSCPSARAWRYFKWEMRRCGRSVVDRGIYADVYAWPSAREVWDKSHAKQSN